MVDPDLELRGGGGGCLDFLALLAFFPSVISSFFTENKGGGPGSPGPSVSVRPSETVASGGYLPCCFAAR